MSEYVVMNVLRHHRRMPDYARLQAEARWKPLLPAPDAARCRVGLMGFGVLGRDAADKLRPFGFALRAWTRHSPVDAIEGFHGEAGLMRSEEHTSELQSLMRISYAVFCLKKKKIKTKK